MVGETRAVSEMPVTFDAVIANMGERARELVKQSLHVWMQACVTSFVHDLLYPLRNSVFRHRPRAA